MAYRKSVLAIAVLLAFVVGTAILVAQAPGSEADVAVVQVTANKLREIALKVESGEVTAFNLTTHGLILADGSYIRGQVDYDGGGASIIINYRGNEPESPPAD